MKKVVVSLISAFAVLLMISCGSKPAAETSEVEAPVLEQETDGQEEAVDPDDIEGQIAAARKKALEAGAEKDAADQLKMLDDAYAKIKDDPDAMAKDGAKIARGYKLLAEYLKAKNAKKEIDDNGFASLLQKNYDEGVKNLNKVEAAYAKGADSLNESTLADAEAAYANFTAVLAVGYKKLAKAEREAAYEAKKKADSVKAGVSQKDRYKAATDKFKAGDSSYAMQNGKKALENYRAAKEEYLAMYEEIAEKRAAAQKAIEEAKARVAESESFAEQADKEAPITEKVEGIEDEDAVLLEEDTFKDPKDAEIDVSEDLTVMDQVNIVGDELQGSLKGGN